MYNSTMKIPVHMSAYGMKSDIRQVTIPDDELTEATNFLPAVLELTFKYGQNDFQPLPHPSVSIGDVVEYNDQYFIVMPTGFKEITKKEFKIMPHRAALNHKYITKMYKTHMEK